MGDSITSAQSSTSACLQQSALALVTYVIFYGARWMKVSESNLLLLNAFSGGMLVGALLYVILPEGFEVASRGATATSMSGGVPLILGYLLQLLLDVGSRSAATSPRGESQQLYLPKRSPTPRSQACHLHGLKVETEQLGANHAESEGQVTARDAMDSCSRLTTGESIQRDLNDDYPSSNGPGFCGFNSAFLGLLLHCTADGIALGGSSLSASEALRLTVFLAIITHKLPVAFATATLIQQEHVQSPQAFRRHALAFSLSTPLTALLTKLILQGQGVGAVTMARSLLFAAGTFCYVAIGHIIPEILASQPLRGKTGRHVLAMLSGGMAVVPLLTVLVPEHRHR